MPFIPRQYNKKSRATFIYCYLWNIKSTHHIYLILVHYIIDTHQILITYCTALSYWKKNPIRFPREASLGIIGAPMKSPFLTFPLKPTIRQCCDVSGVFSGAPDWAPMLRRDASLSDSYTHAGLIGVAFPGRLHTEISFRNLIKSTRNQIVYTIFRLIWIQTDTFRLPFQMNLKMVNTI